MAYQVKSIADNHRMEDFLHLPGMICKGDKNYIAPVRSEIQRVLNENKNPYFRIARLKKFVCYYNGKPAARAIAVINPAHWSRWNKKSAFFGFYESVNDGEATRHLFKAIEDYCADQGAEYIEGPFNPNHYSEMGILTENYVSPPVFFETYNPDWYPQLLENSGFTKEKIIHTRINTDSINWTKYHCRMIEPAGKQNDFSARHFNFWHYKRELEIIRDINNDAFSENQYFLPLSGEEYRFSARYMFLVTKPDLITIIEYKNKPVGIVQCVFNVNPLLSSLNSTTGFLGLPWFLYRRGLLKEVVIFATGVKKEFRNTTTACLIFNALFKILQKYTVVSTTWMSDENTRAKKSAEKLGLKPYKQFTIYSKIIK